MSVWEKHQEQKVPGQEALRGIYKGADAAKFARRELQFRPDRWQARVLRSKAKRIILNCTRQWGKSTVAAAKALHRAVSVPESLVLVASPCKRQSAEWMRKAEGMIRKTSITPHGDGDNSISLAFPNGSRIVGLPGSESTVRGFSAVSLLIIDEAARVPDAMYRALRPMLAVGDGDLWMMSTPSGNRGFFYETWEHGGSDWLRVRVPATQCPRIPKSFLEEERSVMGGHWFRQEHLCEFVDDEAGLFGQDVIDSALDAELEPLYG